MWNLTVVIGTSNKTFFHVLSKELRQPAASGTSALSVIVQTPISPAPSSLCSSQDQETLAKVQQEALGEKYAEVDIEKDHEVTPRSPRRKKTVKRTRPPIIMNEDMFKKIRWTRPFISGPVDPVSNPSAK